MDPCLFYDNRLWTRDRLQFQVADLETWVPQGRFDLIVLKQAFHHIERLEAAVALFESLLTSDGGIFALTYVRLHLHGII